MFIQFKWALAHHTSASQPWANIRNAVYFSAHSFAEHKNYPSFLRYLAASARLWSHVNAFHTASVCFSNALLVTTTTNEADVCGHEKWNMYLQYGMHWWDTWICVQEIFQKWLPHDLSMPDGILGRKSTSFCMDAQHGSSMHRPIKRNTFCNDFYLLVLHRSLFCPALCGWSMQIAINCIHFNKIPKHA